MNQFVFFPVEAQFAEIFLIIYFSEKKLKTWTSIMNSFLRYNSFFHGFHLTNKKIGNSTRNNNGLSLVLKYLIPNFSLL